MKKLTRNLIEEDSSQCLKILSQYTVKKTKIDLQRFEMFCLRENEQFPPSTNMISNTPAPDHLDELLCNLQCFSKDQRKKDRGDSESDTMSSFQKTPASHWRLNTYSALSFDRIYLKICL